MKKRVLLVLFAVVLVASSVVFGACAAPAPGPVKLVCSIHLPPPPPPPAIPGSTWLAFMNYADRVKVATDGRVEIEIFWGAQLGSPTEHIAMVGGPGVADCAVLSANYNKWEIPLTVGRQLPFLTSNMAGQHKGFWDLYETWQPMKDEWDVVNIVPIFSTVSPPYTLSSIGKPIQTLDDFKGMKLWGSGYYADAMNALGAQVMSTPAGEVYDLMAKGALDGVFFPYDGHKAFGWWELEDYQLNVDFVGSKTDMIWVINKDVLNQISKADQEAMIDTGAPLMDEFLENYKAENLRLNEEWAAKGIGFTALSAADQAKWAQIAGIPIQEAWLAEMDKRGQGDDAKELLKRYKEIIAKYPGSEFIWPK